MARSVLRSRLHKEPIAAQHPLRRAMPGKGPRPRLRPDLRPPAQRRSAGDAFHALFLGIALALAAVLPAAAQDQGGLVQALGQASLTSQTLAVLSLVTVLSLAPGIAVMITCFPFIVTVLSILRQAIGLAQAPPNMLIVALSLFLTWYIMEPVFLEAWAKGVLPLIDGRLDPAAAATQAMIPFRAFMAGRVDPDTVAQLAALRPDLAAPAGGAVPPLTPATVPLSVLVPSFMLSEMARAFQIGFIIFLPFLIIDLVVSAVLMSMGMMMVPPAIVALPFKLAFFVLADGWTLLSTALVRSYM
jgi:flagellar biosynthetic protein FliP